MNDTKTRYTLSDIRNEMIADGSNWFDADTMSFFQCRILPGIHQGDGGIFFLTSEKPPNGKRAFSVRQYDPVTKHIGTVGPFCEYTEARAARIAKEMAVDAPVKMREVMIEFDYVNRGHNYSLAINGTRAEVCDYFRGGPINVGQDDASELLLIPRAIVFDDVGAKVAL